jgi:hypothetical protein
MGAAQPGKADGLDEAVLLSVLSGVGNGDFSVRMPLDWTGVPGKIADRLNEVITANQTLGADLARASRVVGREGKLSQRVVSTGSGRAWADTSSPSTASSTTSCVRRARCSASSERSPAGI